MNTCLLLIDIQNDYFPGGKMELVGIETAAGNATLVLEDFRAHGRPIVHIQHVATRPDSTFFLPETAGVEIHSLVAPQAGETIIQKQFPNSFRDTGLLEYLKGLNIEHVTICGAMSHMCIDATTRAAFDLGFQCTVIEDACATRNLQFKEKTVNASEVHASFMAALSAPYANIVTTEEILGK